MNRIGRFDNEYYFLSNFFEREFEFEDRKFKTVEHAFQAHKTIDNIEFEEIINADTPGKAKRLGRRCCMRRDWEDVKLDYMYRIALAKFTQHKDLGKKLIDTQPSELIEGNTWNDTFWGVCNGVGENHLGKILMLIRDLLIRNCTREK